MATDGFSGADKRAEYRVRYPTGYPKDQLPRVVLKPETSVVFGDLSETGLRVELPEPTRLPVNAVVRLTITPYASAAIAVEGTIVRIQGSVISVKLRPPALPWKVIMNEQRAILAWQALTVETKAQVEGS